MVSSDKIFIGVAWPYANGSLHLGHLAGCYLPADIFARFCRMTGKDVLMVSGSDEHGTPITITASNEGVSPKQIVDRYHREHTENMKTLGISFDLFTRTTAENHRRIVQEIFKTLYDKGYIYPREDEAFYCEHCRRFLPDRYIEGTCPYCGNKKARGDQCDECGKLLAEIIEEGKIEGESLSESIRQAVQIEEITTYGPDHCPAGPNIDKSDAIIVVEGRRDVLNLLRHGIKNAIAVEGTSIPKTIIDLSKEKVTTAFVDGDRGGELILRELLQVAEIDFVARAPQTREVEELPYKLVMKALKNKIPAEQYADMYNIELKKKGETPAAETQPAKKQQPPQVKKEKRNILSPKQENYKAILKEISGTLKAVLLDKEGKDVKKIPVRELTDELKKVNGISTVVFDGVITQRLLDIASDKGIGTIVGIKLGSTIKKPASVKVITKDQLQ